MVQPCIHVGAAVGYKHLFTQGSKYHHFPPCYNLASSWRRFEESTLHNPNLGSCFIGFLYPPQMFTHFVMVPAVHTKLQMIYCRQKFILHTPNIVQQFLHMGAPNAWSSFHTLIVPFCKVFYSPVLFMLVIDMRPIYGTQPSLSSDLVLPKPSITANGCWNTEFMKNFHITRTTEQASQWWPRSPHLLSTRLNTLCRSCARSYYTE